MCNGCSGTLTSQEGLVSLLGAERMRSHFVVAGAMGPALRAGNEAVTKLPQVWNLIFSRAKSSIPKIPHIRTDIFEERISA
jgi:hypothetical protein